MKDNDCQTDRETENPIKNTVAQSKNSITVNQSDDSESLDLDLKNEYHKLKFDHVELEEKYALLLKNSEKHLTEIIFLENQLQIAQSSIQQEIESLKKENSKTRKTYFSLRDLEDELKVLHENLNSSQSEILNLSIEKQDIKNQLKVSEIQNLEKQEFIENQNFQTQELIKQSDILSNQVSSLQKDLETEKALLAENCKNSNLEIQKSTIIVKALQTSNLKQEVYFNFFKPRNISKPWKKVLKMLIPMQSFCNRTLIL